MHPFNGSSDGVVVPAFGRITGPEGGDDALARGMAVLSSDADTDRDGRPDLGVAGGGAFRFDDEARRNDGCAAVATLQPMGEAPCAVEARVRMDNREAPEATHDTTRPLCSRPSMARQARSGFACE